MPKTFPFLFTKTNWRLLKCIPFAQKDCLAVRSLSFDPVTLRFQSFTAFSSQEQIRNADKHIYLSQNGSFTLNKKPLSLNVQQQFTLLSCSWTTTWNTHTSWDKQPSNCTPRWAPTMRRSAKRCPLVYVSVCLCKRAIICFCANPAPHVGFQITETENMMDRIVSGLSESSIKVRLAAVRYGAK